MRGPTDDVACGFNPWFEYLREVKRRAREQLEAGEDPARVRRLIRGRIGGGRNGPMLDRLRSVATLALDAVLPPEEPSAEAGRAGPRQRVVGNGPGFRLSRG